MTEPHLFVLHLVGLDNPPPGLYLGRKRTHLYILVVTFDEREDASGRARELVESHRRGPGGKFNKRLRDYYRVDTVRRVRDLRQLDMLWDAGLEALSRLATAMQTGEELVEVL